MDNNTHSPPPSPPALRRRNSISTTSLLLPPKLTLPSQAFRASSLPFQNGNGNYNGDISDCKNDDVISFELASLKPSALSYTSLKDILPSTGLNSPTPAAATPTCGSGYEISIRNRLVKQAAWAYLQPMSSSPDSTSQHFLRRLWLRFSTNNPITSCIRFITVHLIPNITQFFDRIIRVIRAQTNR